MLNEGIEAEQSGDEGDLSSLDSAMLQEQITILNARLDQRSSEYDELKNELNRTREECINLQGIKQGLQSRLTDQEQVMMKLKAELLKLGFSHQTTNSDKDELQKILEERDREIALLRSQLVSKDDQLDKQRKELEKALARIADVDIVEVCMVLFCSYTVNHTVKLINKSRISRMSRQYKAKNQLNNVRTIQ